MMILPMFLPSFGAGGGSVGGPRFSARVVLGVASVVPFAALAGVGYATNGMTGLLLAPCMLVVSALVFLLSCFAVDALNHTMEHEGLRAAVFVAAYVLLAACAFAVLCLGIMWAMDVSLGTTIF